MYRERIHDVDYLKRRFIEEWAQFGQTHIDGAIKQWRSVLGELSLIGVNNFVISGAILFKF